MVEKLGIALDNKGYIKIDENNMTSINGVFAGGDIAKEIQTVAWAARSGRNIADSIDIYINNRNTL